MTNLTEKQRAALTALRDVMKEHDIVFWSFDDMGIYPVVRFDIFSPMGSEMSHELLTILLEQETE